MKVLGVVLDWRLTSEKHVLVVAQSCNYPPSTVDGTSNDTGGQSDTDQTGLLQLISAWSSS